MLVALTSLLIVGVPILADALFGRAANVVVTYQRAINGKEIALVAHNAGDVAGFVDANAQLFLPAPELIDAERIDLGPAEDPIPSEEWQRVEELLNATIGEIESAQISTNVEEWSGTGVLRVGGENGSGSASKPRVLVGVPLYLSVEGDEGEIIRPSESRQFVFRAEPLNWTVQYRFLLDLTIAEEGGAPACVHTEVTAVHTTRGGNRDRFEWSDRKRTCKVVVDSLDAYGNRQPADIPVACEPLAEFFSLLPMSWSLEFRFQGEDGDAAIESFAAHVRTLPREPGRCSQPGIGDDLF